MRISIFNNKVNYIKAILLLLPVALGLIDFISTLTTNSVHAFSNFIGLTVYQCIEWLIVCVAFSLIAFTASTLINNSKSHAKSRKKNIYAIGRVNYYFKIIFISIGVYKFYYILDFGYAEFFIMARWSQIPIGPALYFMIIMFPMILSYDINKNGFSWSNNLSLFLLIVLNLMTGYRLLLVYGIAIIVVYNWRAVVEISKYKIIYSSLILGMLLIGYEVYRQEYEAGSLGVIQSRSSIDSMNRSAPLNTMELIKIKKITLASTDVFRLFLNPLFIFLDSAGLKTTGFINTQFNLEYVNEPLFKGYLRWRGTPSYNATGFSISIVSYSYLFNRLLGLIVFAVVYGLLVSLGCRFVLSNDYWRKLLGSSLLVNLFICNESVVGGTILFVYGLIFLSFLMVVIQIRSGNNLSSS